MEEPVRPSDHSRANATILIVDACASNLDSLEAVLAPLGQRIVRASSGEQALQHVARDDFALVSLDVHLPMLDGFANRRR